MDRVIIDVSLGRGVVVDDVLSVRLVHRWIGVHEARVHKAAVSSFVQSILQEVQALEVDTLLLNRLSKRSLLEHDERGRSLPHPASAMAWWYWLISNANAHWVNNMVHFLLI